MHFSSNVIRPPYEANSVYLQITSGCSHNACKFCTYYKDVPFRVSPLEEIREDLQELKDTGYSFPRIWLQGADPFLLTYDKLKAVADLIHEYLPFVKSIGGYGRVDSVKNKTVEQIKSLKAMGYDKLVFGIESGDDAVLKRMNKGYEAKDIVEQLGKLTQAGMDYAVIFLSGLGGHGYGLSHAIKTAEVLNHLTPFRVMAAGLTLFPDTPLMDDVRNGSFVEATEAERIKELQTFIEHLEISTLMDATNASIITPIYGNLPDDKQKLIATLQNIFDRFGEDGLRARRDRLWII
jgi:radical SAM superfamily enzyme YgiQ (UPF0313 family)